MSFLVVAVLVGTARLLFPGVDLRRNVPATAALIVGCLVIERLATKYMSKRG
jgi:hypothetical protein